VQNQVSTNMNSCKMSLSYGGGSCHQDVSLYALMAVVTSFAFGTCSRGFYLKHDRLDGPKDVTERIR